MSEWRLVGFGDPNAMRSTSAPAAPCGPSDGHHSAASHAPVAPEADLVPLLETSVTLGTNKSGGIIVLAAILHVTGPETRVTGPYSAVSEVAVARHLGAECLSAQTPTCGLQHRCVARVVAARDLELGAVDQPKSGRDHVFVVCGFRGLTDGGCSVVPIFTAVFHPVFIVVVGESGDKCPVLFVGCHVTVYLRWRYSHVHYFIVKLYDKDCSAIKNWMRSQSQKTNPFPSTLLCDRFLDTKRNDYAVLSGRWRHRTAVTLNVCPPTSGFISWTPSIAEGTLATMSLQDSTERGTNLKSGFNSI